ncbi:SDR family NAD(P)-dependent oxidoreductase [Microbacterium sp.]|uniref:SDR family NAD(P)-dependent oxidoreductase n=1 Tax=Microbacterium sp. TaxID=51671 RepID=UPI002D767BB4|nr:SDR family NAD(P)-dependent oxidoreductase [Microbacterium sp.]HET6300988.1 SDR family NAD(P)-dependent oxidoreductase [Microbacterium sp.]
MSEGPVVVITGASSGIGRATAQEHARRGARLVLAARNEDSLETVAEECRALGAEVRVIPTDVSQQSDVHALAVGAVAEFGRIDVWVGNAGVFAYGSFEQLSEAVFRQVIETNLMGQVHGARAVLPYFRRQGSGTLVLVGSLYSRVSSPMISPYVASKFGVLGFAESLRQELRGSGIRVRVVLPATVDTPIYQNAANVTGRHVHPLPPASSPRRVARAIVRAPDTRRTVRFVGRVQTVALLPHRMAPGVYDTAVRLSKERVELRGTDADLTVGTVFEPPSAAGGVTGGWRSVGARIGAAAAVSAIVALLVAGGRLVSRAGQR